MKKLWKILLLMVSVIGALCAFAACDSDGESEDTPHVHTYSRFVEQSPTCTQTGVKAHLQCIWCKKLFTDEETPQEVTAEDLEMEMIPHVEVIDKGVEATCTSNGWTEGKHCSVCLNYLKGRDMIPAKGHKIVTDAGKAATCTEDGITEGKHCSVCKTVFATQRAIPATGHKIVTDKAQALTCTQDGKTEGKHCSLCDTVFEPQTVTPATGHMWNINNSCNTCGLDWAYTEGLKYTLNKDGESYSVTGHGSAAGDITIPAYYEGKPVTAIGETAFLAQQDLTGITLPDTITRIESMAFCDCSNLTSVTLSKGLTHIGVSAFAACEKLKEISLPNTVKVIESVAFQRCSKLTSLVIPKSVESIGGSAFLGCSSARITVESGNPTYHSAGNCLIETATKTLLWGRWDSVIPADGSVTVITSMAFYGCWELTNIVIPNGVTYIGAEAFAGCDLLSITIPKTVTIIDSAAFAGNHSLAEIKVEKGNETYHSEGNCLIETATKTLVLGCEKSVIPDDGSVTTIGRNAFANNISVKTIVIPDKVTSIKNSAFSGCGNLTKIVYGDTTSQWILRQQYFGEDWDRGTGDYTVQCTDGTLDKKGNKISE